MAHTTQQNLSHQVVLLTGASQGLGVAIAHQLASMGMHLALTARQEDKLLALQQNLHTSYPHCQTLVVPGDVQNPDHVETVVNKTLAHFNQIDVLINNAGVAPKIALLQETTLADIDRTIDTNLKGPLYFIRAVLPGMVARQSGMVININSVAGKTAYPYWGVYDASKFGLHAITDALREEQRQNNIKVVGIYPGAVDTPIWDTLDLAQDPNRAGMLSAQDVAHAVAYVLQQPQQTLVQELVLSPLKPAL